MRIDPQTLLEGKNDEVDEVFSMFVAVIVLLNYFFCSLVNSSFLNSVETAQQCETSAEI